MILIFTLTFQCYAQQRTDVNTIDNLSGQGLYYAINGEPFVGSKFSKVVEGSPFFKEEWMKGAVILNGGKQHTNLSLKINLLEGNVIYLNDRGIEIVITNPIKEVVLTDVMTGNSFKFLHSGYTCNNTGKTWFSVLDSGKVQLLRNEKRVMTENKPYGSATIEQHILNKNEYFILTANECIKIKSASELSNQLIKIDPRFKEKIQTANLKSKSEKDLLYLTQLFNKTTN